MSTLLDTLSNWRPFHAIVVGDLMLDQLVYGDAERMTADAPVPVLTVNRTEQMPGGAANVCLNLVAMHASVSVVGVVGGDGHGQTLIAALAQAGVNISGVVADPSRPTTVKQNLIGLAQHRHPQKMFRLDHESTAPLSQGVNDQLLAHVRALLPTADVLAIEDYNKGVCSTKICRAIIEMAREAGVAVVVDPASIDDYSRYARADVITPNRSEAERATGMRLAHSQDMARNSALAKQLQDTCEIGAVVLTLDREGALLLEAGKNPVHLPTRARHVYDVTGAGDMVLAALLGARANGCGWPDAVRLANTAAGLEVEVFGVRPIPIERIHQAALVEDRALGGKGRTLSECLVEVQASRREGKKIVFTNGCFDILHAGHIKLLREAARLGDVLIVAINADDSIRRLKGEDRPVHGESDRVEVLSELESVDLVVVFEEDTPERLLESIKPDILAKGGDYEKSEVIGGAFVESYGGRVELIPVLEGRSTTGSIQRIRQS